MNKSEFTNFLAKSNDCSQSEANRIIDMFTAGVKAALEQQQSVNLVGFGSFSSVRRNARQGRNPKTGEPMKVDAWKSPVFRAGKTLKEAVRG